MKSYKTALGKNIDMGALISKNEKVRAVGNMKVNARGDEIDSYGRITKPVTSKVNQVYAGTVGNRSGQIVKKPSQPEQQIQADVPAPTIPEEELTQAELEMEAEFDDDDLVEQIKAAEVKAQETKKGKK